MTPSQDEGGTLTPVADLSLIALMMETAMSPLRLSLIASLALATPALAQGTQQGVTNQPQKGFAGSRAPVATQPSNSPFRNPIGQGVPPAVSANPNLNSNRTNVR